jgi:hypothetical protein
MHKVAFQGSPSLSIVTQLGRGGGAMCNITVCRTCTAASCLVVLSPAAFSVFSSDCSAAVFFSAFFAAAFAALAADSAASTACNAAFSALACCTAACFDALFPASTAALTAVFDAHVAATVAKPFLW